MNEKKVYCLKCIVNNDNKKCFICDNKIKPFEEKKEHLSASHRGQILHEIMADFWNDIKNSQELG